jgi:hypothetical protein
MTKALFLLLACAAALSASAGAGYLAIIGPAPLRFAQRPKPVQLALAALPPLQMHDPEPVAPPTNIVTHVTATNAPQTITNALPVEPVTNAIVVPAVVVTNLPVVAIQQPLPPPTGPLLGPLDASDPNSLMTAQMLIHYFRPHGTNAVGVPIATPLFVPPRPAPLPPSSTVRYTTP